MARELVPIAQSGDLPQQRLFVAAYDGEVETTAEKISIPVALARRWAAMSWFRDALEKRYAKETRELSRDNVYQLSKAVIGRLEIQAFWSDTAANTECKMADRLKASEMLAKSHGMLADKVVVEGNAAKPVMVAKCDIDSRLHLVLEKVVDAVCVPSQPIQEITDDDGSWLDAPSSQSDAGASDSAVRGCVEEPQHRDDAVAVP